MKRKLGDEILKQEIGKKFCWNRWAVSVMGLITLEENESEQSEEEEEEED